jgi:hypothetical protein
MPCSDYFRVADNPSRIGDSLRATSQNPVYGPWGARPATATLHMAMRVVTFAGNIEKWRYEVTVRKSIGRMNGRLVGSLTLSTYGFTTIALDGLELNTRAPAK